MSIAYPLDVAECPPYLPWPSTASRGPARSLSVVPSPRVVRMVDTQMPLSVGRFTAVGYQDEVSGDEIVALTMGVVAGDDVLVRLHSECLTGDAFGSLRCDCGPQLDAALTAVAAAGRGVVVYLRGHEGRGIGLLDKLRAYRLQDAGADTLDANLALGLPGDARDYGGAAAVLVDLGVRSARLITNNPAKVTALSALGVRVVERVAHPAAVTPQNRRYLATKRDRMAHQFGAL